MRYSVGGRLRIAAVALALVGAVTGGCEAMSFSTSTEPVPCAATYSVARCEAILAWLTGELGIPPSGIDRVDIVPPTSDTMGQIGNDKAVTLRVGLPDGPAKDVVMHCGGISGAFRPECMAEPQIVLNYPGSGSSGYRDTPVGAAPFPSLDPAAVAASQPLLIAQRTVTIDKTGPTRVVLGQARLANGVIQEASIELGDAWPDNVVILGGVTMDITPAGGGGPIWNIFEHGWHDGVELVEVSITFDAAIVREGAALELVNVVVR